MTYYVSGGTLNPTHSELMAVQVRLAPCGPANFGIGLIHILAAWRKRPNPDSHLPNDL